jgi:hypothetical protein
MNKKDLRDYFAGKAMQAFIPIDGNVNIDCPHVSCFAYAMADCMLEARKSKKSKKEQKFNHVSCPAYPNCDEDPNGCRLCMGNNVEEYGMRD